MGFGEINISKKAMRTILASYDLRSPGKDYSRLWEHLRSYSDYRKPLESLWLLKTAKTSAEVRDGMKQCVDSNDKLFVVDITGDAAAWKGLPDEIANWIKENI